MEIDACKSYHNLLPARLNYAIMRAHSTAKKTMIDLYTWGTPNGQKVSIMLEETGLPYTAHPIDITRDEQFAPAFLKISPNNKIPAIRDRDNGMTLMESGAILWYLAQTSGQLLPSDIAARWRAIEWLMFQVGGLGPMLGQSHHFCHFQPGVSEYAEKRYMNEARRLYGVLEKRLAARAFLAGEYSIADIAAWPWVARFQWQRIDLNAYPNVKRWYLAIADRPAVQRGMQIPAGEAPVEIPRP